MYYSDYWRPVELNHSSALSWIFADINDELSRRGQPGDIYLVGDAAMFFLYDAKRIDYVEAILSPKSELLEIAEIVTADTFLEEDWLRDSPRNISDIQCRAFTPVMQFDYLTVWHPGDKRMVAIKFLEAFQSYEAANDAIFLIGKMGISSEEELLAAVLEAFPERLATRMDDYLARTLLERVRRGKESPSC